MFVSVRAGNRSFIVFGDEQRRIAECDNDCEFWAWPGAYRVRLKRTEHEPERSFRLRISHSGSYELSVKDSATRNAGLVLGITGSAVAFVGTLVLFAAVITSDCSQSDASDRQSNSCSTPPAVYYGLATLAVGGGLAAGGFVVFGANQTGFHFNDEHPPNPISARVGPVPMPHGGAGLGATISF